MASPEIQSSSTSPKPSDKWNVPFLSSPRSRPLSSTAAAATVAYERYLRLPELSKLWNSKDFPDWTSESVLKPSLHALEITFRLIPVALSDPRPYANHREWTRRLESLAAHQIELIATLCEDDNPGAGAPVTSMDSNRGVVLIRRRSTEVWKLPGADPLVSRTSEESLLPRLANWEKSEDLAAKILFQIESQMRRCNFTLGLGEPNLTGKPSLEYDLVVRPSALHAFNKCPFDSKDLKNEENRYLFTIHQILECWVFVIRELLKRSEERIHANEWDKAASDCWVAERIWKLLAEVEDLHLLLDSDDFLRLKSQLDLKSSPESEAFCFRSAALIEATRSSKDLRQTVPWILGVEVDPDGGPRVQEAAMMLFHSKARGEAENAGRIQLLQAMQAVEAAVKKFYFSYRQLVVAVMGSLEGGGNRALHSPGEQLDSLSQMFLEPAYFPSLDAAKTFLGVYWQQRGRDGGGGAGDGSAARCGAAKQ